MHFRFEQRVRKNVMWRDSQSNKGLVFCFADKVQVKFEKIGGKVSCSLFERRSASASSSLTNLSSFRTAPAPPLLSASTSFFSNPRGAKQIYY